MKSKAQLVSVRDIRNLIKGLSDDDLIDFSTVLVADQSSYASGYSSGYSDAMYDQSQDVEEI